MRKVFPLILCMLLLLSGCNKRSKQEEESMKNYETFINAVINNKGIETKSIPFDYRLVQQKLDDGSYEYEVQIDNPRVAMYDIQAIAVNQANDSNTNVYPCIGILGKDISESFNLIPYQSNPNLDYWKGIGLNGISKDKQFTLNVMVSWKDSTRANKYSVFFNCSQLKKAENEG